MKLNLIKLILLCFIFLPFVNSAVNLAKNNIKINTGSSKSYLPFPVNYHGVDGTLFIADHPQKIFEDEILVYFLTNQGRDFDFVTVLPFDDIISVLSYEVEDGGVIYILGRKKHETETSKGFDYNYIDLDVKYDQNNILRATHDVKPFLYKDRNCFDGISGGEEKRCEYTDEASFKAYLKKNNL